jgi:hypothetical protein
MTDTLYFSRDTKVYIEVGANVWEMPVLDGFSFSQATNASEITLNEMSDSNGVSRRARQMFTDSFAPAEWSFSTYARPFVSAGTTDPVTPGVADTAVKHHAVEEVMWSMMVGDGAYASNAFTGITPGPSSSIIDFDASNKVTLGTCNMYFVMGGAGGGTKTTYKIEGCCVNEASLDFDIDGIAAINWSGFGKIITEATAPTATVYEAVSSTSNFIRNRLTNLSVTHAASGPFVASYDLVLTGGNVTISNGITFLTPETLGVVNQPLGHVTGTRSVSGNFTCYLNAEADSSADLFEALIESTDVITHDFGLTFKVGGTSGTPRIELAMAHCHLEVPTHSIDDVISIETNFHALPSNISDTDELVITYVGA